MSDQINFNDIGDNELACMMEDVAHNQANSLHPLNGDEIMLILKGADRLRRASARHRSLSSLVFNNKVDRS